MRSRVVVVEAHVEHVLERPHAPRRSTSSIGEEWLWVTAIVSVSRGRCPSCLASSSWAVRRSEQVLRDVEVVLDDRDALAVGALDHERAHLELATGARRRRRGAWSGWWGRSCRASGSTNVPSQAYWPADAPTCQLASTSAAPAFTPACAAAGAASSAIAASAALRQSPPKASSPPASLSLRSGVWPKGRRIASGNRRRPGPRAPGDASARRRSRRPRGRSGRRRRPPPRRCPSPPGVRAAISSAQSVPCA